jgi:HEAT repeat protein
MRIKQNAKVSLSPITAAGIAGVIALACCSFLNNPDANADGATTATASSIYRGIPADQIESLSTGDRIKSAAAGKSMMAIWQTLEHGEKVECTDCIPSVAELLYDANPRTREISAWWLRRRIFGVFGPGEVYEQTVNTLATDPDPIRRQYAANALGEFLAFPGINAVATALQKDQDAGVRAAAAAALGRLGDHGNGALSGAFGDADPLVRLAALKSAGRINGFKDAAGASRLANDPDATVRRNTADLLGSLRSKDGYDALAQMAGDADPEVRNAAAHSLGALHDPRAVPILTGLSTSDPNGLVRDQAAIALKRL